MIATRAAQPMNAYLRGGSRLDFRRYYLAFETLGEFRYGYILFSRSSKDEATVVRHDLRVNFRCEVGPRQ